MQRGVDREERKRKRGAVMEERRTARKRQRGVAMEEGRKAIERDREE
jgi:hypothetical protein